MSHQPKNPGKDQDHDPKPEPIDPPADTPPAELPGSPVDRPNA
jgi:hypothetical protein